MQCLFASSHALVAQAALGGGFWSAFPLFQKIMWGIGVVVLCWGIWRAPRVNGMEGPALIIGSIIIIAVGAAFQVALCYAGW